MNAIACQQLSLVVGIHLLNRLAERCGPTTSERNGAPSRLSPPPNGWPGADPQVLRELGFSGGEGARRGSSSPDRCHSGEVDLETLRNEADEAALASLARVSPASGAGAPSTPYCVGWVAITCCPVTTWELATTSAAVSALTRGGGLRGGGRAWHGPGGPTGGSCTSTYSSTPWRPSARSAYLAARARRVFGVRDHGVACGARSLVRLEAQPKAAASPLSPLPGASGLQGSAGDICASGERPSVTTQRPDAVHRGLGSVLRPPHAGRGMEEARVRPIRGRIGTRGWVPASGRCPLSPAVARDGRSVEAGGFGLGRRTALAPGGIRRQESGTMAAVGRGPRGCSEDEGTALAPRRNDPGYA